MSRLPALSPSETVRALSRAGFVEDRQKGSHLILLHPASRKRVVVPMHQGRSLKRPLLLDIIKQAGLTQAEFELLL